MRTAGGGTVDAGLLIGLLIVIVLTAAALALAGRHS
jgi:hypothetical protein